MSGPLANLKLPSVGPTGLAVRLARWRRDLLDCLPRRARRWLASRHPDLVIAVQGDKARVYRDIIGERQLISALDLSTSGGNLALSSNETYSSRSAVLELPSDVVLKRRLVLPTQVRDNLRRVLTYELDRLTPFSSDQVFFDARIAAGLGQGSKIDVELALCPREQAKPWLEHLAAVQRPVSTLTWRGAWPGANLLPADARPRQRQLPLLLTGLLFAIVVAMLAAVLITPLWQRGHQQEQLTEQVRRAAAQAEQVSQVREALERARLGSMAVLERKREQPRMSDLLLQLTDLLPDGTWVQTLNYRDGEVDIRGESTQATALISILERGPGISKVTFRSPVMQAAGDGGERFHISFEYQPAMTP